MKYIFKICFFAILFLSCIGKQDITLLVKDSRVGMITNLEGIPEHDTLYFLRDWNKSEKKYVIKYNDSLIAAAGYREKENIVEINYWRNGNLKQKKTEKDRIGILETFCSNGQLISKVSTKYTSADTTFHCNGMPMRIVDRISRSKKEFYDTGKLATEGYFNDKGAKEGLYTIYYEDGKKFYQFYIDNRLIYQGDSIR